MMTDLLSLSETARLWLIPAFLLAGLLHLYFGWRLAYLKSMTQISQKIARGEEPDPNDVLKITE